MLEEMASELGLDFTGVASHPADRALKLQPVKIGLWDRYGGSMDSGWNRYILDKFEFDYELVFAPQLNAGNLNAKYDVLMLPSGACHDAQILSEAAEVGMIFIPCENGISHSPEEKIEWEDLERGANLLLQSFIRLAQ